MTMRDEELNARAADAVRGGSMPYTKAQIRHSWRAAAPGWNVAILAIRNSGGLGERDTDF